MNFEVDKSIEELVITIDSPRSFFKKIVTLVLSATIIYSISSIFLFDSPVYIKLIGLVFIAYIMFEAFQMFFWLHNGYEKILIKDNKIFFHRKGITKFNKKIFPFDELKYVELTVPNDLGNIDVGNTNSLYYGLSGGKIILKKSLWKKVEFGISLNDSEAKEILHLILQKIDYSI